jgi:site-specific DNA-adenine methylase
MGYCVDVPAAQPFVSLRPPYPWFGGKRQVAAEVWRRFGAVRNYIEPFFGGGAVLLGRPLPFDGWETINDIDANVANFWRAVKAEPAKLAELMDWPVNETDLEARHKWLCRMPEKSEFAQHMKDDPDMYDLRRAAWWCWGISQWIGSGWCAGEWHGRTDNSTHGTGTKTNKRPKRRQGVQAQMPNVQYSKGIHSEDALLDWILALANRLRHVRVCCGDWSRICGDTPTIHCATPVAVFLDPPYSASAGRDPSIYTHDNLSVALDARDWALTHGNDPRFRIALCGYEGEYPMPDDWSTFAWKSPGGFGNLPNRIQGQINCHKERIFFSPHCIQSPEPCQPCLQL